MEKKTIAVIVIVLLLAAMIIIVIAQEAEIKDLSSWQVSRENCYDFLANDENIVIVDYEHWGIRQVTFSCEELILVMRK